MSRGGPEPLRGKRLALAGFIIALSNFAIVLDLTITNVAIPHIAGSLAVSPSQGTWTITSYAVAEGICVPLSGWLALRFGLVRTYIFALIGFGLFSMLCGFSQTLGMLVVGRIFQGFCGAPIMPISQSLMMRVFPEEKRNMALGLWAITTICAPVMGPILGGLLSDNWSWPWVFFINVPVVALGVFVISQLLPPFETKIERNPIDLVGLILIVISVAAFQIMLDTGADADWFASGWIVGLAVIAGIGFTTLVIWEMTDAHPMVDVRVFRHKGFAYAAIAFSLAYAAFFASIVLTPLWMQKDVGYSATEAGYAMAFMGVLGIVAAPFAAKLMGKIDTRATASFAVFLMALTGVLRAQWSAGDDFWTFALPQILQGIGVPFYFMGLTQLSLGVVDEDEVTTAAGILSFLRTLAGAAATTIAVAWWDIESRTSRSGLAASLNGAEETMKTLTSQGMSFDQARAFLDHLVDMQASTIGVSHMYYIASVAAVVAAAIIWLIPRAKHPVDMSAAH
jgi:MFS transporter, DHA2 family, multidrug resistance protein